MGQAAACQGRIMTAPPRSDSRPTDKTVRFPRRETFDAVVCSLVLCSVSDPGAVLAHLQFATTARRGRAISSMWPAPALRARCSGSSTRHFGPGWRATVLTQLATYRTRDPSTPGFVVDSSRRSGVPAWVPLPVSSWLWAAHRTSSQLVLQRR